MDFDSARNVATFGGTLISIGTAVYAWLTSRSKINAAEIRELQALVNAQAAKIQALETTLQNMPSKDTVHKLDLKVTTLNGTINVVAESLQAVERTAHRIEEFLLSQAKK
ncbi:MAG: DUF2730 family protein [Devosia sp.]|nr:DUF2730 family protein [Devosia sp.]